MSLCRKLRWLFGWKFHTQDSRTNTAICWLSHVSRTAVASLPLLTAYAAPTPEQAYGYGPIQWSIPTRNSSLCPQMVRLVLAYPIRYPYAGLYGQQPASRSSFVRSTRQRQRSGAGHAGGQPQAWPWGLCSGSEFCSPWSLSVHSFRYPVIVLLKVVTKCL